MAVEYLNPMDSEIPYVAAEHHQLVPQPGSMEPRQGQPHLVTTTTTMPMQSATAAATTTTVVTGQECQTRYAHIQVRRTTTVAFVQACFSCLVTLLGLTITILELVPIAGDVKIYRSYNYNLQRSTYMYYAGLWYGIPVSERNSCYLVCSGNRRYLMNKTSENMRFQEGRYRQKSPLERHYALKL